LQRVRADRAKVLNRIGIIRGKMALLRRIGANRRRYSGMTQLIGMELHTPDPVSAADVRDAIDELAHTAPAGVRFVEAPSDELKAIDPQVVAFALGFVGGLAGGAGKAAGEEIMKWLITALRERLKGKPATLVVGTQQLTISAQACSKDEHAFAEVVIHQAGSNQ
jgi:hypothetical protein